MILPAIPIDQTAPLAKYFMPHQSIWIQADDYLHAQGRQAFCLAEKSVRIGWTFADAFKNVRKRLHHKKRDYLFATRDYPSALEYIQLAHSAAEFLDFTRAIVSHGEDYLKVNQMDPAGKPTSVTEEIKIGYIKFDNGSRIIAFSSHPYAMAVYGGDVGLDEFAKHPNAELLWQTAQGRVTWGFDLAVWSSHDGENTLFNQFVQQARALPVAAGVRRRNPTAENSRAEEHSGLVIPSSFNLSDSSLPTVPSLQNSTTPSSPWNLYFRVTISDAVQLGLLDLINRTQNKTFTADQFLADCRARAGSDEIFEQSYMCNPLGSASASIVEWSAIERCRDDYEIDRIHLEPDQVRKLFGEFNPATQPARQSKIQDYLDEKFPSVLAAVPPSSHRGLKSQIKNHRLGFDVAASGKGDLAAFYIDAVQNSDLVLRALFTVRTEDWDFLKTVLFHFLEKIPRVQAAADESGLGRQICWEAAKEFPHSFRKVNFAAKKHELGFALMNQLSIAEKRFPRNHPDIAADYFALRKLHNGTRWVFTEGRNQLNLASHCDLAWAAALATFAHSEAPVTNGVWASVVHENGWSNSKGFHPFKS